MVSTDIQHFQDMGPHVIIHTRGYALATLLEGHLIHQLYFMLGQSSFAQIQVTVCKQMLPFEQQPLACFCSDSGHSVRPWRSKASKTHPFDAVLHVSLVVLVRWTTGGTWLAEMTCPTMAVVGISMAHVLKLHRQIGNLEEPGCSSP